jgi:hypothetical protein
MASELDLTSERRAFEAYILTERGADDLLRDEDLYRNHFVQEAWEAWTARASAQPAGALVTREVFDAELEALGEAMAERGAPVIRQLLREAHENRRKSCRFDAWPARLKVEAYQRLGLEPVTLYRRTRARETAIAADLPSRRALDLTAGD